MEQQPRSNECRHSDGPSSRRPGCRRRSPRRFPGLGQLLPCLLLLCLPLLQACSTAAPLTDLAEARLSSQLRQRGLDPRGVVRPMRLSSETRAWLHSTISSNLSPEDRLRKLLRQLTAREHLDFQYEWGHTGTAEEVFRSRRANCLAFTSLFVAMARDLGLDAYFMRVQGEEAYRKDGDLIVVSDHVVAALGPTMDPVIIDFAPDPRESYRLAEPISDLTALALFHSNRGAESLQRGEVPAAVSWLRTSIAIDEELPSVWRNLGVALRRSGEVEESELAYRQALELDPGAPATRLNLAALLRRAGRAQEAQQLEQALSERAGRNPFTYLALGDLSLRQGRAEEAARLYRRAARLGDHAECYAALGEAALQQGDLRLARKMLRRARSLDPEDERARLLASRLPPRGS